MAEKFFETMADRRERKLDETLKALAAVGDWAGVLEALDHFEENNDRRHDAHRDDADVNCLDGPPDDVEYCRLARGTDSCLPGGMNYFLAKDWDDVIFSREPEDLHQLVTEDSVSMAIRGLTPKQKGVLLDNIVFGVPAKDLARMAGCSVRNVTKQRQSALEKIRMQVSGSKAGPIGGKASKQKPKPRGCGSG